MNINQILTHLGENRKDYFQAVSPPIIQTSNFVFPDLQAFRQAFSDEMSHHLYTRGNNPTVKILREKLAALEGAEDCLVFSSGSAAIANTIISQVKAGDHVVCVESPYTWTKILLTQLLPRFGVETTFVDGRDLNAIEQAIQGHTRLLFLESPTSLTFHLQDLEACAKLAKRHGLVTAIDNSYSTPLFQRPIDHGIDFVIHSGTKYLNGHSDVVVGVVCGSAAHIRQLFELEYMTFGAILPPQEAALVIRGLRTLPLRMQRVHETTMKVTQWLEKHPLVAELWHPHSPSHPQHELALRQMSGSGGLFGVRFQMDTLEEMEQFVHRIKRFLMAVSWGGHESLMIPTCGFYNIPGKPDSPLPFNLIRFSIGLEDADWLIEDLEQALNA